LAEIFERFKAKKKVTNIIQLRDESASIKVAKLTSQSNARKPCYIWEIVKCSWKKLKNLLRIWRHL